jgi:hypothetical protein
VKHAQLLVFALAACHPAPTPLSLPDPGFAQTAVYLISSTGDQPRVFVSDLANPAIPELGRVAGQSLTVHVFYYGCAPDVLGLSVGLATLSDSGHPIPPARNTYAATIDDSGASAFVPVDHPTIAREVKIDREIRCAKFDLFSNSIPGTLSTFGIWIAESGEEEVVVALYGGSFYRVPIAGPPERIESMEDFPSFAYHRERDDRVWLFGNKDELAVGDLRTGVFERRTFPERPFFLFPPRRGWLAGSAPGHPFELIAFHDRNTLSRFDGEAWTTLYQGPVPVYIEDLPRERPDSEEEWRERREAEDRSERAIYGGAAWNGPSDAHIFWALNNSAKHSVTGTVTNDPALLLEGEGYLSFGGRVPGLGTVAGTSAGRLFVRSGAGWTSHGDAPIASSFRVPQITGWAPLDDGLLIAGGLGLFTQLQPELERSDKFCHYESAREAAVEGFDPPNQWARFLISDVTPLGCGFAFVSKAAGGSGDIEIGFLKRK